MRIAFIDCVGGASGDMFLGAVLHAGAPRQPFDEAIASLGLGARVVTRPGSRHALGGLIAAVEEPGGRTAPGHAHPHTHTQAHDHHHDHAGHGEPHAHPHDHGPDHTDHGHAHPHARGLAEILAIVAKSGLSKPAKERVGEAFRRLAEAEGEIHGMPPEKVHFHEVGAVDAIVDIVGAVVGFELLGIESAHHSPVPFGTGQVAAAHGMIPLPGPAALRILRGRPVRLTPLEFERTTPTGAALLATLARPGSPPIFSPERVGYGLGSADPAEVANVLRIVVGEAEGGVHEDTVVLLDTNVDDMSPQAYEPLFERLFAAGALDVAVAPILMKKGRPAHSISVIAEPGREGALARILLTETPTLGIRVRESRRLTLPREEKTVASPWGPVRVKVAILEGTPPRPRPEYDDCLRIARETGLPFLHVYETILRLLG